MSFHLNDRISIFGALRPNAGQLVSKAVVTTYSLDLIALLGLVLALGGDGEAEFENSPLGLVTAFDSMRGKLRVIHQAGRILVPRAHRAILPLLDTMLEAIGSNETSQSWHPKVALVRYDGDPVEWRLWIGSRNLTGSRDIDAGLMLVSSRDRSARVIPDIAELARDLLSEARFTDQELDELRAVRWVAPPGITVRKLLWRRPGETRRFIEAPLLKRGSQAIALSPFIDKTGLEEVLRAGSRPVTILTTELAAGDCAPFDGIEFRTGSAPEPELVVSVEQQLDAKEAEFTEQPSAGVHAKLLAVSNNTCMALMIGSANITGRGLIGPNAEAIAIVDVTDQGVSTSLQNFVNSGFEFDISKRDEDLAAVEEAQRQLDEHISLLLQCSMSLIYAKDGLLLIIHDDADAALASARFEVAPFLNPNTWVALPSGLRKLRLIEEEVTLSEQTSLVSFRATSLHDPTIKRSWLMSLPAIGIDQDRRDQALLARYVGASRFRDWLRSQLEGIDWTSDERWSDWRTPATRERSSQAIDFFALETMLSAWARDPLAFERRIAGVVTMLTSFRETFEAIPDEAERRMALADLAEVQPFVHAVRDAISGRA